MLCADPVSLLAVAHAYEVDLSKRTAADFFIGNMLPTCITDDVDAAKAVLRRALTSYAFRPNYRNYWKEAGYVEEMAAIERAIDEGRNDDVPTYLTDRWLADCTLFGPPNKIRDGIEAWREAGVHTPIIVPSSAASLPRTSRVTYPRGSRRRVSVIA